MSHYICTGGCGGVSDTPGACRAEDCPKHGKPLEKCEAEDCAHAEESEEKANE